MHPVTPAGALVGRDSEIALLTRLITELGRGRGGSLLIEGEPGIGKSALVQAAVTKAPEAGCQVFWGAGDELGQALPLLPFLDGLRVREPSAVNLCGAARDKQLPSLQAPAQRIELRDADQGYPCRSPESS